jgi:TRAP-type mannitol/chloroaromatic compound transport system permease large subunit
MEVGPMKKCPPEIPKMRVMGVASAMEMRGLVEGMAMTMELEMGDVEEGVAYAMELRCSVLVWTLDERGIRGAFPEMEVLAN